jgi:ligand-binding SRPBCC domain-containing protein
MKIHRLERTQILPLTLKEAWDFFSTPLNLNEITPDDMSFEILSDLEGQKMHEGMIINYKVRPIANIPLRWTTEIKHVKDHAYFVDEQRFGPYSFWHHKHFFEEHPEGVKMQDVVDYALPFGPLGDLAHAVFVKKKLQDIFNYRYEILEKRFPKKQVASV